MAVRVVDYSPLTAPVSASDVATWRAQSGAAGAVGAGITAGMVHMVVGAAIGFATVIFLFGNLTVTFGTVSTGNSIGVGVFLLVLAGSAALVVLGLRSWRLGWVRRFRLAHFAEANGMTYSPGQRNPSYPGEIFQLGSNRTALDHMVTASGRFVDMGNFQWVTGSGKNRTTHTWGFLALSLDRNMPNIVLDSKANNTILGSDLPATLDRSQILHLEGDFDRYFTLYCPAQYEQDALYIFTPDLMALLIDEAAPFDVELIDDWMFVYASRPFDMTDPAVLQRLFRITDTVGAKALRQTERYADARVGDPGANLVAPQGARLKRRVPVAAAVVVGVFVVIWGWTFFGPIIAGFTSR